METITQLRSELAEVEATLRNLQRTDASVSGWALNPAGDIGGIRSRSEKRKEQINARRFKIAHQFVHVLRERESLNRRIADMEADGPAMRSAARDSADRLAVAWFAALRPGDTFRPGNFDVTITRKARKSLTTAGGAKWTIQEVTGVHRADIDALLNEIEATP